MSEFRYHIYQEDCLDVLRRAPDGYFDSMVTDPPAGIGFMGREWDSDKGGRISWVAWMTEVMSQALRVLKPGAHALVWAIPRTSHWTATALEEAGFEIRDICTHHYGSGFPKSQDVGKFINKLPGYRPDCDDGFLWEGWGTALKPATEHWILVRKPLSETSIARNVLKWGTGALNIDACRVHRDAGDVPGWHKTGANGSKGYQGEDTFKIREMTAEEVQERCGDKGRWPTNLFLSDDAIDLLEEQAPGASRFFPTFRYVPKPSRSEREAGLNALEDSTLNRVNPGGIEHDPRWAPVTVKNNHPTVKSAKLMAWLCALVTPAGGLVLDPFCGSGSTGVACMRAGFRFVGIEQDDHYCQIATGRIDYVANETNDATEENLSLTETEDVE